MTLFRCRKCGAEEGLTLHHVVPLSQGGPTCFDNLATLCDVCHRRWHKLEELHFRLPFWDWLSGETPAWVLFWYSELLREIYTGRRTNRAYSTISQRLNGLGITTLNGRRWARESLRKWVIKHAPEMRSRRDDHCFGWPVFGRSLREGVWRVYHYETPVGLAVKRLDGYQLVRYDVDTCVRDSLVELVRTARPCSSVICINSELDLLRTSHIRLGGHFSDPASIPSRVILQNRPYLRLAKRSSVKTHKLVGPHWLLSRRQGIECERGVFTPSLVEALILDSPPGK